MLAAGFSLIHSYATAGNETRVWQYVADANKTYGKAIIEAQFTSSSNMNIAGYSSYNPATSTGLNKSSLVAKGITLNLSGSIDTCNHPECRGILITLSGSNRGFLGYFRPAIVPIYWDENNYPCFWIDGITQAWNSANLQSASSLRPSMAISAGLTKISATVANTDNGNKRAAFPASLTGNGATLFDFSSDCILAAANGMNNLDTINNEYTLFDGAPNTFARFAIRTSGSLI